MKPLVHVVDDDAAVCDATRALLTSIGIEVACHDDPQAFLQAPDTARPGCILLDLRMPGMSGLVLQRRLRARGVVQPVILVTGHGDVASTVRAMHQGAADVLTKPVGDELLLQTVQSAIDHDRGQRTRNNRRATIRARIDVLTPREAEVLKGVVAGDSNKHIARGLAISPKTVELHRANMMAKMHAESLAELVRLYLQAVPEAADGDDVTLRHGPDLRSAV